MSSLKEQYIFEKPQPLHFILPLTPWHRPLGEGKVTLLYLPRAVLERHYAGEEEEAAFSLGHGYVSVRDQFALFFFV